MDPERLKMIYRVAQEYQYRKTKSGTVKNGPYWFGYWMEKGKVKRVYIGKDLTPDLQAIYDARFKLPGRMLYSWPGRAQAA